MKISKLLLACAMLLGMASASAFAQTGICPSTVGQYGYSGNGNALDCNLIITFNADGSVTTTTPPNSVASGSPFGVYESNDDALIGVVNLSGAPLTEFTLTSQARIFGFLFDAEADGICNYIGCGGFFNDTSGTGIGPFINSDPSGCDPSVDPSCLIFSNVGGDTTGYGGPIAYFTPGDDSCTAFSCVVHIGNGGLASLEAVIPCNILQNDPSCNTTYFSLERPDGLDSAPCVNGVCTPPAAVPEPETYALMLAGLALMGVVSRRRKQRAA